MNLIRKVLGNPEKDTEDCDPDQLEKEEEVTTITSTVSVTTSQTTTNHDTEEREARIAEQAQKALEYKRALDNIKSRTRVLKRDYKPR